MAGCSGGDGAGEEGTPTPNDAPIAFDANAATMRGVINDTEALQKSSEGFGVFAYYTEGTVWGTASSSNPQPNFMNNQQVTYGTSAWTYTPVKYWPNDNTNKYISFFAYAPYRSSDVVASSPQPTVSYTWSNTLSDQTDLLYDNTQTDLYKTTTTDRVTFTFRHALAAVEFKVRRKNQTGSPIYLREKSDKVMTVTPSAAINTSGTFNLVTGSWGSPVTGTPTVTYAASDINSSILVGNTGLKEYTDENAHLLSNSPNLLLLMPKDGLTTFNFTIYYTLGTTEKVASSSFTLAEGIKMGTKYTVILVIDDTVESYVLREREAEQW